MNTIEILKTAKSLIAHPKNWTQHTFARDVNGVSVDYISNDAVCWCVSGAFMWVGQIFSVYTRSALKNFEDTIKQRVIEFNDSHNHTDVIAAIDSTIKRLENLK